MKSITSSILNGRYLYRFAQADSIVPPGVQGLDRYAYVNNSPMNYVDPSGHVTCTDDGICGYSDFLDEEGNVKMANALIGCGIHCSRDEIAESTLDERLEWVEYLRGEMDSFQPGAGDWFVNIQTVVEGFSVTEQDSNSWVLTVDTDILYALQEGFATYVEGGTPTTNGGQEWYTFFGMLENDASEAELINQWGWAEFQGTNDGLAHAGMPGVGDDLGFLAIGTVYRGAHFSLCYVSDCGQGYGGFFNPKTTMNGMASSLLGVPADVPYGDRSPVALALYPIYYGDYLGVK